MNDFFGSIIASIFTPAIVAIVVSWLISQIRPTPVGKIVAELVRALADGSVDEDEVNRLRSLLFPDA